MGFLQISDPKIGFQIQENTCIRLPPHQLNGLASIEMIILSNFNPILTHDEEFGPFRFADLLSQVV